MESGVGASLREARRRRRLELADVEAAIKIRARFLRAIEDEDWDILPGGAYTRGFIRTYATFLGLDGDRLAERYRAGVGAAEDEHAKRTEPVTLGSAARPPRRLPRGVLTGLVVLALAGILVAVGLIGDGDEADSPSPQGSSPAAQTPGRERETVASRPGVSLAIAATAEVWVCLLDADEEPLLDGEILQPGAEAGPFRSDGFSAAFGNGAVELTIDGDRAPTPAGSSPVGYQVGADGELTPLEEGERPDCE